MTRVCELAIELSYTELNVNVRAGQDASCFLVSIFSLALASSGG